MKKDSITTLRAKIKECKLNRNRAIKAGQIYNSFYWANALDKHIQNRRRKMQEQSLQSRLGQAEYPELKDAFVIEY